MEKNRWTTALFIIITAVVIGNGMFFWKWPKIAQKTLKSTTVINESNKSPTQDNQNETTIIETERSSMSFNSCGTPDKYRKEIFFPDFQQKMIHFIVNVAYPQNIKTSDTGDILEELPQDNYVKEICYAKDQIVIALIFYDFHMMGGFNYLVRYNVNTKEFSHADMELLPEIFILNSFGKQNNGFIEVNGSWAEGLLTEYSALYDVSKNIVYPKQHCIYKNTNNKQCESFELPHSD